MSHTTLTSSSASEIVGRIIRPGVTPQPTVAELATDAGHHDTSRRTEISNLPIARVVVDSQGVVDSIETLTLSDVGGKGNSAGSGADELPLITPGFVDLHNHGGAGGAFPTGDESECRTAANYHRSHGTVALLASTVSQSEAEISHQLKVLHPLWQQGLIRGVHLEGPFLNVTRKGAQSPDRIIEGDPDMLARIIARGDGIIRQITIAPETTNVHQIIDLCARHHIICSFGHTDADFDTTARAIAYAASAGATVTATHLFNAMPPLHHRAPGAAGALLDAAARGQASLELVADGVHLADGTVDMVTGLAAESAFAVTDAMEAAGLDDGHYVLGPLDVIVANSVARLCTPDGSPGAIAGGTSTLADQFARFSARHGFAAAARFTSTNAARVLGDTDLAAGIAEGLPANFVVMRESGEVVEVFTNGEPVSRK